MLKQIRCAVYTRKSCEDGLNQEFNSLDAQRVSGESYIKSQQLKGWVAIEKKYDDGGFSGGNLERPGLKELFKDIERRRIDLVVVYKMDRLSRSLLDFAKVVDLLKKHEVAFVSVTESFNTADPVGELMLNIIMSFAQYERELASMRIRDKIAESRKQGLWMGSRVPLGYDAKDKKLIINEKEAELVKHIFERFADLKSIVKVTKELNEQGYQTKELKNKGGEEFKKATVKGILTNPTYIGFVSHKGTLYKGKHEAIIDQELWNKVKENFSTREQISTKRAAVLLKGLMRCYGCDTSMQPTYARKKNKEYRYYVCGKHLKARECKAKDQTIAAGEIEQVIMQQVPLIMSNSELIEKAFKKGEKIALGTLEEISKIWENIFPIEQENIIHILIKTIWLKEDGIKIEISKEGLKDLVSKYGNTEKEIEVSREEIVTFVKLKLKKSSGKSMILVPQGGEIKEKKNDKLLKALVRAHLWQSQIDSGEYANIKEICHANKISCPKYVGSILKLNFLASEIKEAILEGKQPPHIRLNNFMGSKMDLLWERQLERFYR
ncbi:recombinase family protein [Wolbachia endosymbiont of Folsomia candida]|uniref:recombinase family protein n=1 Tax=Wolbachia endosymbiont of Folsomia candida TaxID=169402 RepID=UPI000B5F51C2|nr:recombinase family protein [Wolbachia endosymbiont of Folsomia candida]APR98549.1 recombinase family protein [Wolbachia endosymbiont of Folsomia candida]APR98955.1 recombinase family protein [Wolbachia endosymbiont of Folsomia candida]